MALPDEKDLCGRIIDAHSDHGTTGTSRGSRAALIAASDAESMHTIGRKQRLHAPCSKVNRRLHLGCACLKPLGDGGQRHRPPSTRAHASRGARFDAVAGLYSTVENTRSRAVWGPAQDHRAQPSSGETPHGFMLLLFAV